MILHEIRRPNSLKKSPQWSRQLSQPTLRQEGKARLKGASSKKGKCAESPPTFIRGKRWKNRKRVWSTNFKCERFGNSIYARGRYQHPTRPSQGTTTFNQVCKYDFNLFYFPFYVFMSFYAFFFVFFLSFCGRQGCFPCSYVFLNL